MPLKVYHGTIKEYLPEIKENEKIETSVGTFDDEGVFLTHDKDIAFMWARSYCENTFYESKLQNKYKTCTPIALEIEIPNESLINLKPDWNRLGDIEVNNDMKFKNNLTWQESKKMGYSELKHITPIPYSWIKQIHLLKK